MAGNPNICDGCDSYEKIKSCCVNCEQGYCQECTAHHMKCRTTRLHILMDASNIDADKTLNSFDVKFVNECGKQAVMLCLDCKQLLCNSCTQKHARLKATNDHNAITAKQLARDETLSITSVDAYSERRTAAVLDSQELVHAQV
ncbi:Hypothetical predicted protein [Mytilus galloprovincialis]|uniref:B box-type domain-containing protein n=1 Tax=Mytilus galloprovincialis TaxID=29158 RepID=A0A8B6GFM4_MYTGA|nr:Hypothetical predicted protein [Mytilus galloprovincialis]